MNSMSCRRAITRAVSSPLIAAALIGLTATAALAHEYRHGGLVIGHPWSRETAKGQSAGGGFLSIRNENAREDRLIAGSSPVAAEVQIHTMSMDGGVMRMRQLKDGLAVPAKGTVELKPGGLHLMFIGLKRPLKQGERVPVTLQFQRAGKVTVQFAVQSIVSTQAAEAPHGAH